MIAKAAMFLIAFIALIGFAPVVLLADSPSVPPATNPSTEGLDHLRAALKDAYEHGDIDAMTRYLHPEVVVIFPDGSVLKGRDAFRDYYKQMMTGPNHRVVSYSADPQVESRTVHNDVGLSYGDMNDSYVLNDGRNFALNSRFTVTVFKSPEGPADTSGWMIRSFHSSADAFDNPVITMIEHGVFLRAGIGGLVIGIIFGVLLGFVLGRRRKAKSSA